MVFALKIEKEKKKANVKTLKEIIAFIEENPDLELLQKQRNNRKYFVEKLTIVLAFTTIAAILALAIVYATELFMKI